ncbi:hypothetical protein [Bradyrhizobium sp. 191]|uniref:hypothetical protein n=1 Tax=Bradyrhizobium sp. 191 TaxID=2782659 RepID=UPI001FFEE268|nr:hypothetical protein [Bradyrhizobium sp. 191]UPJ64623.1 hypothetical protein IVB23_32495 [Bradyrhizobium sp. 191]
MNATIFSLALLASSSLLEVSDKVPELKVEALCKATSETDKAMALALPQSFSDCMRDETTAQQQLGEIWAATKLAVRDLRRCWSARPAPMRMRAAILRQW